MHQCPWGGTRLSVWRRIVLSNVSCESNCSAVKTHCHTTTDFPGLILSSISTVLDSVHVSSLDFLTYPEYSALAENHASAVFVDTFQACCVSAVIVFDLPTEYFSFRVYSASGLRMAKILAQYPPSVGSKDIC